MNTNPFGVARASCLGALLFVSLSCGVNGQNPGAAGRPSDDFPEAEEHQLEVGVQTQLCGVVVEAEAGNGTHLTRGHRLFVHGPFPSGNFQVIPVHNPATTPHPWVAGTYWALNISAQAHPAPQEFMLYPVKVVAQGEHSDGYDHAYKMIIQSFDPQNSWCAKEVILRTGFHPSETGDDHGGDVHLVR